jgi:hypothetical protein
MNTNRKGTGENRGGGEVEQQRNEATKGGLLSHVAVDVRRLKILPQSRKSESRDLDCYGVHCQS